MTVRSLTFAITMAFTAALTGVVPAHAQTLKDPQWQALFDAGKHDALEQAAQAQLKAQAEDAQALAALALSAQSSFDVKRLEVAYSAAQQCEARAPQEAICYLAKALVMGQQAQVLGPLKALSLVGRIKDALNRALELDPAAYMARSKLVQIYLFTPSFLGGSVSRAKELEAAIRSSQPEQARLLRALIAAKQGEWDVAERELLSVRPGQDVALLADIRDAYGQLGRHWSKEGQPAKARSAYEQLLRDQPTQAAAPYYLGRLALDAEQPAEAVKQFERAKALEGAGSLPLEHRLGDAWVALGDKVKARAAYERAIASKQSSPGHLEDARKSLAKLG